MTTILLAEKEYSKKAIVRLKKVGEVVLFDSLMVFKKNLKRAEVIVTALEVKLDKSLLDLAPKLYLIGSRTTQLRYIDLDECAKRNIKVVNVKTNSFVLRHTPSTAEEAMALILALWRNIPWAFNSIKQGRWERKKYGGRELEGKTIGLIGFGRLGRLMARYSKAFGLKTVAYDPYVTTATMRKSGVKKITLERLLCTSDVVSLHAAYNNFTRGMLKEKHFRLMKPVAIFINTARGEITDEKALLKALKKQWIAGAAIDTLANESPDGNHLRNNPLVQYAKTHENLIIVPHLGGATKEATERTQIHVSNLIVKVLQKRNRVLAFNKGAA